MPTTTIMGGKGRKKKGEPCPDHGYPAAAWTKHMTIEANSRSNGGLERIKIIDNSYLVSTVSVFLAKMSRMEITTRRLRDSQNS